MIRYSATSASAPKIPAISPMAPRLTAAFTALFLLIVTAFFAVVVPEARFLSSVFLELISAVISAARLFDHLYMAVSTIVDETSLAIVKVCSP